MHRYCCIVVGTWMLRDWHIYHKRPHVSKDGKVRWTSWDRVL